MTATPIPRTLNMSLVGIRDMSIIETPPKDRLSIQTNVGQVRRAVIERASATSWRAAAGVLRPQPRRVDLLDRNLLQRLVPRRDRRSATADGRGELERAMLGFVERQFDILLATTIVENGLDIPNANTIIINSRRSLRAVAALSAARPRRPIGSARVRVSADSAAGIAVARGAQAARGDQGVQRSRQRIPRGGARPRDPRRRQPARRRAERHIDAVGFEMYMKLLEETSAS
jgi:transcription-repair coupling factor (superfamily II helicase)